MPSIKLFPTQIYLSKNGGKKAKALHARLVRESLVFMELDDEGKKWSKKNYLSGYTSYSSITDLPYRSSNFEALKKLIDSEVQKFVKNLELDLGHKKLTMNDCWVNVMGQHCHHASHLHPLSVISGTYFLQTPKGAGALKFEDPRLPSFMGSPPRQSKARPENRHFYEFKPQAGDLILFESWLKHEVTPNQSKTNRISVSFNYHW
jgi:uncharacterized protein (TIGR02466 family)